MKARRYQYVGPPEIRQRARRESHCEQVKDSADLVRWGERFLPASRKFNRVTATFIIDLEERLWIADRRSEHVGCADGQDVLAAGEITFERRDRRVSVAEITNQSTGYCPELSTWSVVASVLSRLGIAHPPRYTTAFEFRRCEARGATNLIKDDLFECALCSAELSAIWNFG